MFIFDLGKYKILVISIALFLVFDLGVLTVNFVISSSIEKSAISVNLAGRQRTISQRMVNSLLEIKLIGLQSTEGTALKRAKNDLKKDISLFDDTLVAFRDGTMAHGVKGDYVPIRQITDPEGIRLMQYAFEIWTPYRRLLEPLVLAEAKIDPRDLEHAQAYAIKNNNQLLDLMNEITSHVEYITAIKLGNLRIIQVGGITLATINFFIILLHFVRHLRKADKQLEIAKQETDDILETVSEGLFLLDREYKIGTQRSAKLHNILRGENLAGTDFFNLLGKMVPERTLETARSYVELLFGDRVNENLVTRLNPLDQVEVTFSSSDGSFITRHLAFHFNRVLLDNKTSHLLVTVSDISERVALERALRESQEKGEQQMDLLMDMLHVDPKLLKTFLDDSAEKLQQINTILKQPGYSASDFKQKLKYIFRNIHAIKGESAALGLGSIESRTHRFEDSVTELQQRPTLSGNDFLSLAVQLDDIMSQYTAIRKLLDRIGELRQAFASESAENRETSPNGSTWWIVDELAKKVAAKQNKKVAVTRQGLDDRLVPEAYRKPIKDILLQLVRNAVSHGIETPDQRKAADKPEVGNIAVSFITGAQGNHELVFRDDGAGINVEKLKEQAVACGRLSNEEAASWDTRRLLHLIFEPNLSTADKVDEDAGRGVGMDFIRNAVNSLKGHLKISTVPGKFTQFRVLLPVLERQTHELSKLPLAKAADPAA